MLAYDPGHLPRHDGGGKLQARATKPLCSADAARRDLGSLTRSLPLLACGCSYHCCSDCGSPAVLGLKSAERGELDSQHRDYQQRMNKFQSARWSRLAVLLGLPSHRRDRLSFCV